MGNLDAVAALRFHHRDEPFQRRTQGSLPVESEDRGFDVTRHEEQGPAGLLDLSLNRRAAVLKRGPSG